MLRERTTHLPLLGRLAPAMALCGLLVSCTADAPDAAAGDDPPAEHGADDAASAELATSEETPRPEPIAGFSTLAAHCPFPYRLQYPEGLKIGEIHPMILLLRDGDRRRLTLQIHAEEGSVYKEGLSRTLDQADEVQRAGVIRLGGERVPVYAGTEPIRRSDVFEESASRTYQFWYPTVRMGDGVMWHRMTATALARGDAELLGDDAVLQVLGTLELEEC